jgi:transposase-like protein
MGRRNFTREFKLEAVKLVRERGVSVSQVARDLGIGSSVIGRWVRENQADKSHAFPGRGQMKPDDAMQALKPRSGFIGKTLRKPSLEVKRSEAQNEH